MSETYKYTECLLPERLINKKVEEALTFGMVVEYEFTGRQRSKCEPIFSDINILKVRTADRSNILAVAFAAILNWYRDDLDQLKDDCLTHFIELSEQRAEPDYGVM